MSPELGRWINRDPIEEYGGLNLLAFIANNVMNAVDFMGHADCDYCARIQAQISRFQSLLKQSVQSMKSNPAFNQQKSFIEVADTANNLVGNPAGVADLVQYSYANRDAGQFVSRYGTPITSSGYLNPDLISRSVTRVVHGAGVATGVASMALDAYHIGDDFGKGTTEGVLGGISHSASFVSTALSFADPRFAVAPLVGNIAVMFNEGNVARKTKDMNVATLRLQTQLANEQADEIRRLEKWYRRNCGN